MINNIEITDHAKEIAGALLDVEAVKLSPDKPFIWSSGWNSPIYCDNRVTLSYPPIRALIKQRLTDVVKEKFNDSNAIAGVATAGIPQGALISDALGLPYLYVRSKPKGHGMENLIEGKLLENSKVVLVEDLISTGGSVLKAAEAMRNAGGEVAGVIAIFTYGFPQAEENFQKSKINAVALSDYNHLINEAVTRKIISDDKIEMLQSWRNDPANWQV